MSRAAALLSLGLTAAAPCPPADGSLSDALPHVGAALHLGGTLNVLAVGSAPLSPDAPKAAGPGMAAQMAHALEAAVPGLHVALTVRGGHALAATDLADAIRGELGHASYGLVLWQTGTVDAIREVPPDDFEQTLSDGAARVAAAHADLVLIDPQYSRFIEINANIEPYLGAMRAITTLPGVALFHRYEIMRDWADDGTIDLERSRREDRPAAAARLHLCLGRELARELLAAAGKRTD